MLTKKQCLDKLTEAEGFSDVQDMLESASFNGVAPGICPECEHMDSTEPDQDKGYCEGCGKQTLQSCLVLGGVI